MATKINQILQRIQKNDLVFSSWMSGHGVSRTEQGAFVKSGWLDKLTQGVYKLHGSEPTLFNAVSSYNSQLGKNCFLGASTALDLRGFSHFVPMGKQSAYLFTPTSQRLPSWLLAYSWDMNVHYFTTNIFGDDQIGIDTMTINGDIKLLVSSPERAFMECLHLSPNYYSLMDTYYVMETLSSLRPKLIESLLDRCSSVKVKRLFLFMAEKSNHPWFSLFNVSAIDLGKGKRSIVKGGVYDSKYKITIPYELKIYE